MVLTLSENEHVEIGTACYVGSDALIAPLVDGRNAK